MRRIAIRYVLLNKRLFKKYSFLLILCMVPLLLAGMRIAARQESGIVTVALWGSNPADELSNRVMEQLERNDVLRYVRCTSREEAVGLVESFQADAAWIFPEDLAGDLGAAASGKTVAPVVTVLEREDSIPLTFSREILSSALYPYFSYAVYEDFVRDDMGLEADSGELKEAYERTLVEGSLFRLEYFDGQASEESSYLLAPMRGMLALWLVLCGLAAALYYLQDERRGTFSQMSLRRREWTAIGFQAVLLIDAAAVQIIALRFSGVFTVWSREIGNAVLFAGCTLLFCNLMRLLCGTPERLGSCIPVLMTAMTVLCPVFVRIDMFRPLQYLLPPFYYLNATHSTYHFYLMAAYICVMALLCALVSWRKNRK